MSYAVDKTVKPDENPIRRPGEGEQSQQPNNQTQLEPCPIWWLSIAVHYSRSRRVIIKLSVKDVSSPSKRHRQTVRRRQLCRQKREREREREREKKTSSNKLTAIVIAWIHHDPKPSTTCSRTAGRLEIEFLLLLLAAVPPLIIPIPILSSTHQVLLGIANS